jgi:hypothetical protein
MPGPDPLLQRNQRKMKALLNELTTREGLHPTAVDGVNLARSATTLHATRFCMSRASASW